VRRAGADLGDGGVEVGQEFGGHLSPFDGFREAVEEPGFEGIHGIRGARRAGLVHVGSSSAQGSNRALRYSQL
jgi:hypothetical protein